MNTFLFPATETECCIFCFFLFSQTVQIMQTEYKNGQYCTPLNQSDCRYFFVLAINVCIILCFLLTAINWDLASGLIILSSYCGEKISNHWNCLCPS